MADTTWIKNPKLFFFIINKNIKLRYPFCFYKYIRTKKFKLEIEALKYKKLIEYMMMMETTYEEMNFANPVFIGFMMGLYDVLGKGSQSIANMIGIRVAEEIFRFTESNNIELKNFEDFKNFASEYKLADQIELENNENYIIIKISKCKICPKKVGKHEFDGTACPWGGLMNGILSRLNNEQYSVATRLTPGDVCVLELKKK